MRRMEEYARRGICVLWLLQSTPYLDGSRYGPRLWEKRIHAAYFRKVYYWVEGLLVRSYHFEPIFERKRNQKGETYKRASKRYRAPVRGKLLNLARDFGPKGEGGWEREGFWCRAQNFLRSGEVV